MTSASRLPRSGHRMRWPAVLLSGLLLTSCADVLRVNHPVVRPLQVPSHMRRCPDVPVIPPPDLPPDSRFPDGRYSDILASKVMLDQGEWIEKCDARMRAIDELLSGWEKPPAK